MDMSDSLNSKKLILPIKSVSLNDILISEFILLFVRLIIFTRRGNYEKTLYGSAIFMGHFSHNRYISGHGRECPTTVSRTQLQPLVNNPHSEIEINGERYQLNDPDTDKANLPTHTATMVRQDISLDAQKTVPGSGICVYTYRGYGRVITRKSYTFSLKEIRSMPKTVEQALKVFKLSGVDIPPCTTVKKTYRNLAKIHHPDKGGDTEVFKQINAANEILMKKCH